MALFSRLTLFVTLAALLMATSMAQECVTDSDCSDDDFPYCVKFDDGERRCQHVDCAHPTIWGCSDDDDDDDTNWWLIAIIVLVIVLPVCGVVALIIACCTCWAARKPAPRVVMIQPRPMYVPSQPAPTPACV
ncbi:unnamed protein product [Vitrella brassicaformis CCMP3155]|uniref:Uncharacterized protein n=1 Tax=Vitrella brassicaformis (strain CCMP3155) TaxID=1169540 RepID=A0A0G4EQH4_VITBC|nr:unnamed protein product [Vitrella brassicaformis CCMP3155]|eukprot:CEL99689.1 unnamed protein product [Vitrella brassicaformis CCMP3155]